MVNPSIITKRVEQIEKHLERIRPFASLPYEAFLKDDVAQDVVEYNLFQIVKLPAASCGASVTKPSGTPPERDTRLRQGFGAVTSRFLPAASCGASARRRVILKTHPFIQDFKWQSFKR